MLDRTVVVLTKVRSPEILLETKNTAARLLDVIGDGDVGGPGRRERHRWVWWSTTESWVVLAILGDDGSDGRSLSEFARDSGASGAVALVENERLGMNGWVRKMRTGSGKTMDKVRSSGVSLPRRNRWWDGGKARVLSGSSVEDEVVTLVMSRRCVVVQGVRRWHRLVGGCACQN